MQKENSQPQTNFKLKINSSKLNRTFILEPLGGHKGILGWVQ
jgi:hypothetical protein